MKKNSPPATYPIVIEWSDDDQCYVAHSPAIPYCTAVGDTYEETAREMQSAIEGWLKIARERGTPIPDPAFAVTAFAVASEFLNINAIARQLGVPPATIHSKVRRLSSFTEKETTGIARVLGAAGLHLRPTESAFSFEEGKIRATIYEGDKVTTITAPMPSRTGKASASKSGGGKVRT